MKRRPLRSSKEIFHKLRWNGGIPLQRVSIGYLDRNKGMQEMAFERFRPGGRIPFSRVYYFKLDQELIWDRGSRLDRVFGSGETPQGQRLDFSQVETAGIAAEFQPAPIYHFDSGQSTWAQDSPARETGHLHSLQVVSYNVLRTDQEIRGVNHQRRIPQLIRQLDQLRPDVIALQEVTEPFREMLFRLAWVRDHYWSTLPDRPLAAGQLTELILSRLAPQEGLHLAFSDAKKATGMRIHLNGQALDVITLHLPSDLATAAAERRRIYLRQLNHAGRDSQASLLLGDFNQAKGSPSDQLTGFVDLWAALRPADPGLTFDPASNAIAQTLAGPQAGARLDRMLLKAPASRLLPTQINLLKAPTGQAPHSDHYGLQLEMICDSSFATLSQSPTTQETALVALPPMHKWAELQAIRREHDPHFDRWMPHIMLLFGFLPEALFSAAAVLLQQALAEQVPFRAHLHEFGQFDHPGSTTLWLKPDEEAGEQLQRLQATVQELFPGCKDQQAQGAFRPHLTLASIEGPNRWRASLLRSHLERHWDGIEFEIEAVALLSRKGGGPFRVHAVVTLGDEDVALSPASFSAAEVDLETAMGAHGLLTGMGSASQKAQLTERMRGLLRTWSSSTKVYAVGMDAMGLHLADMPLDLMVMGRRPPAELLEWWNSDANPVQEKSIREGENAGGLFQGEQDGLAVVLRYIHCPVPLPLLLPNRMSTEQFNGFPTADQQTMQQALELTAMRHHIGLHVPVFNVVVQAIWLWAQKHGLTEKEGFLSAATWALLIAWVDPEETADRWLENCFEAFSGHDWSQPFGEGPGWAENPMQVWSLSVPPLNKTAGIDEAQLQQLIARFNMARDEIYGVHQSNGSWIGFLET